MPPSTFSSTMTLTSTCLPVAWDSAAARRVRWLSSSGTALRTSATSCCALGRRQLDEPARRSPGARCARPMPTTNDASAARDVERLAAHELLDHRHADVRRQRRVGERHAQLVGALEDAREAEEVVLDLAEHALGARDLEQRLGVRLDPLADGIGHRLPAPHLVDVALDERDLRVAVEVALDDLLGQLDRQLGDPALQVGQSPARSRDGCPPAARARSSAASASARAIRSLRTWSAASRASSMILPASLRASASCCWYSASSVSASVLGRLRRSRGPPGSCPRGRRAPS